MLAGGISIALEPRQGDSRLPAAQAESEVGKSGDRPPRHASDLEREIALDVLGVEIERDAEEAGGEGGRD